MAALAEVLASWFGLSEVGRISEASRLRGFCVYNRKISRRVAVDVT